ncbi:MAG: lysophospholipid acyltransferase family protein [Sulfurovaceae bacterium]|nr:lysophospholipid acyltransferase family protein [Sulfurovaceae bacterium]
MIKKFSNWLELHVVPFLIYFSMRFIWLTTRKEIHYATTIDDRQYIWACWHGELFISPQAYRMLHSKQNAFAIASVHKDGMIVANTINYLNIKPIKGSTSKGGARALLESINCLREGNEVLITPDGPRGPRHYLNDGVVSLAQKLKLPVCIINFRASNYWQFGSWDRFVIPKPFSKIDIYVQSIILNELDLNDAKQALREAMLKHTII